jgi:hypothetical protein
MNYYYCVHNQNFTSGVPCGICFPHTRLSDSAVLTGSGGISGIAKQRIEQGWYCPKCDTVHAPWVPSCSCKSEVKK